MESWIRFFCCCGAIFAPVALFSSGSSFNGFGTPEVVKLDWSTRSLKSGDLNQDGLMDLVVINNDGTKIELLYQIDESDGADFQKRSIGRDRWDPVLEDGRYRVEGLTIGFSSFDLAVGDFNRDGLVDLAYTARESPLTIRLQAEDGNWLAAMEYDGFESLGWTNTVAAKDLDGDGFLELLVLEGESIRVYRSDEDGRIQGPEIYPITGENPFNLIVEDFTDDGRPDLLYLSNDGKQSLATRQQLKDGGFGPELRQIMDRPARTVQTISETESTGVQLVSVDSRSGFLEFLELVENGTGEAAGKVRPEVYPVSLTSKKEARYAFGDFDQDGDIDAVVADSADAEVMFFEYENGRFTTSVSFPSFSAISSLAAGRFLESDGDQLVVLSQDEKTLGLSRLNDPGRLDFPANIGTNAGEPLVVAAVDFDADGYDELARIRLAEGGVHLLEVLRPVDRASMSSKWESIFELKLDDVRRAPEAIMPLDIFDSSRPGLMLFVPRKAPILLAPSDEETLRVVAAESNVRESLLNGVSPSQISVFDVNGDGTNELVVGRTGYARALCFKGDDLVMVDQFNAAQGDDSIDAVLPVLDGVVLSEIALYVGSAGEIQFLKAGPDGVFRYERSEPVGVINLMAWFDLSGPADQGIVFAGSDRFWVFDGTEESYSWEVIRSYETDLEEVHYSHAASGDFNNDGQAEIIAVDGSSHIADLLGFEADAWHSRFFWEIFEVNMHYQGRQGSKLEPRQILIEDINGDGLLDLVFLIHDRILIYPSLNQ